MKEYINDRYKNVDNKSFGSSSKLPLFITMLTHPNEIMVEFKIKIEMIIFL